MNWKNLSDAELKFAYRLLGAAVAHASIDVGVLSEATHSSAAEVRLFINKYGEVLQRLAINPLRDATYQTLQEGWQEYKSRRLHKRSLTVPPIAPIQMLVVESGIGRLEREGSLDMHYEITRSALDLKQAFQIIDRWDELGDFSQEIIAIRAHAEKVGRELFAIAIKHAIDINLPFFSKEAV